MSEPRAPVPAPAATPPRDNMSMLLVAIPAALLLWVFIDDLSTLVLSLQYWLRGNPDLLGRIGPMYLGLAAIAIALLVVAWGAGRRTGWGRLLGALVAIGGVVLGGLATAFGVWLSGWGDEAPDIGPVIAGGVGAVVWGVVLLARLASGGRRATV